MNEISTRIWLDESLWEKLRSRAIIEGVTVRELIPSLVGGALTERPAEKRPGSEPALPAVNLQPVEGGLPIVALSDLYRCGVCGAEVKLGGFTLHMSKHMKERQAVETERS